MKSRKRRCEVEGKKGVKGGKAKFCEAGKVLRYEKKETKIVS